MSGDRERVRQLYPFNWGEHECAIGASCRLHRKFPLLVDVSGPCTGPNRCGFFYDIEARVVALTRSVRALATPMPSAYAIGSVR